MTDTQVECFIEAAKEKNISKAAENLFLTQQAASSQIKALEKELGFQLFHRSSKGISLTKEGVDFMKAHEKDMPLESHMEYESGRLKDFLPPLYNLWKDLQDPWENVQYDLTTERQPDGTWKHKYDNKPVKHEY